MEQHESGMSERDDLPPDLPNESETLERAKQAADQLAADLLMEQAAGPIPLELAGPGQGEDVVLLVETGSLPGESEMLSPEEIMLKEMGLDGSSPWYRSPWFYTGAGLAAGAMLAAGAVLLLRNRSHQQQRSMLGRAQSTLGQWTHQLSDQTDRLTEQVGKLTRQVGRSSRQAGPLAGINRLTDQAQDQISQLTGRKQSGLLNVLPLQRRSSANKWVKQTQRQLSDLSHQVSDQALSVGSSIGNTTAQAIGKTQEGLKQVRHGVTSGAARTGKGIQTGWKLSRNFTLGIAAGAVWAAIFTPQNGETTRQHLGAIFQSRKTRNG